MSRTRHHEFIHVSNSHKRPGKLLGSVHIVNLVVCPAQSLLANNIKSEYYFFFLISSKKSEIREFYRNNGNFMKFNFIPRGYEQRDGETMMMSVGQLLNRLYVIGVT